MWGQGTWRGLRNSSQCPLPQKGPGGEGAWQQDRKHTPPHSAVWCTWQRALSIHVHFCGPFCTAEARKLNTTLPGLPSNWVLWVNEVPPTRYIQGRLGYGSGGHPSAAWVLSVGQHGTRNCGFFTRVQCPAVTCFTGMKRPSLQRVLLFTLQLQQKVLAGSSPSDASWPLPIPMG